MNEVLAVGDWTTNAQMIADVAKLGYLDGTVLDASAGESLGFWSVFRPSDFTASDRYVECLDHAWDYRRLPCPDGAYDVVVLDPPYKLSGTPALGSFDKRYGIDRHTSRVDVMEDIALGVQDCYRVCRNRLIVKVQDQVEGGQIRFQTLMVSKLVEDHLGGRLEDRFDFLGGGRPQPGGRRQQHARGRGSTLLIFRKGKR